MGHYTYPEEVAVAYEPGKLIVKGKILNRLGKPKFRRGEFEFLTMNYEEQTETQRVPEVVAFEMDNAGAFRVELFPSTNGEAWIGRLLLVDFEGRPYIDKRILPSAGEVDYFQCASALDMDEVTWPEGHTPILVSDFNKPGGPLQLTDQGTISPEHIPGDFLRVDDQRIPELVNYVTKEFYFADQNKVKEFPMTSSLQWIAPYDTAYKPIVECVQSDGSTIEGEVSYPPGTNKVVVNWEAPTSGLLILR